MGTLPREPPRKVRFPVSRIQPAGGCFRRKRTNEILYASFDDMGG